MFLIGQIREINYLFDLVTHSQSNTKLNFNAQYLMMFCEDIIFN
jgi:hypothetical protein